MPQPVGRLGQVAPMVVLLLAVATAVALAPEPLLVPEQTAAEALVPLVLLPEPEAVLLVPMPLELLLVLLHQFVQMLWSRHPTGRGCKALAYCGTL